MQSSTGQATFPVAHVGTGTFTFRVVAEAWKGAAETVSAVRTIVVSQPSDATPPGPVTSLTVTGPTPSSLTLSWTNPADADFAGVVIRRAVGSTPPASPTSGTLVADKGPGATSHVDSGLAGGTTYSYAVFAYDEVPNHAAAATGQGTTSTAADTTPPGPVTTVTVTGATSSSLTVSWTNPGDADYAGRDDPARSRDHPAGDQVVGGSRRRQGGPGRQPRRQRAGPRHDVLLRALRP